MRRIKQRIVASDAFQVITARYHQYKRRRQLKRSYGEVIEKYRRDQSLYQSPPQSESQPSNEIWLCWWQGETLMSPLVKECYDRIRRFNPDKKVILITEDNLEQYVSFPSYILEKFRKGVISKTHMSDLLRAELLARYGGVWMDATIYSFGPVPEHFYSKTLYTGKCKYDKKDLNVSRNRWTSFFWVSPWPEHIFFRFLSDFWREYWKDQETLIEYLLIDYVIDLGYRTIPLIRRELDAVDVNGCGVNLWLLLKKLRDDYSPELIERIRQENWMQKLSYKGEEFNQKKALHPERSVYKALFLDVIQKTPSGETVNRNA